MTEIFSRIIDHSSAWKASDFSGPDDVAFDDRARPRRAARCGRPRQSGLQEFTPDETAMPEIEGDLLDLRHELMEGRGLLLVRGWPIDEMSDEDLALAYWALGT